MGAAIGIFIIVGAAIASFAIPPHRLFRRNRDPREPLPPSTENFVH